MQGINISGWHKRIAALLVCIPIVQTLVCPFMPGLNSDVANMGVAAHQVVHGARPGLRGETPYTGNVRIYLTSLLFRVFGVSRLSLEFLSAIYNALTILCVYLLIKKLVSEEAGLICALIISFSPWFVIRDQENWQYLMLAASLYLLSKGSRIMSLLAGLIMGLGCYEHQITALIPLSLLITYLVFYKRSRMGRWGFLYVILGMAAGFSHRIIYTLTHHVPVYVESRNAPSWVVSNAIQFIPYFLGMCDGTVIYLRNAGCVRFWVPPLNSAIFIGALCILFISGGRKVYRPLVVLFVLLYTLVFLVIKYTAIRYFLSALFCAALISGLGIYVLSLRHGTVAYGILAVSLCLNIFFLAYNFFDEFAATGGRLTLFKLGTLIEASHHLVRTDVLYECLDKSIPVIVCPEPFISRNIQFYDVPYGHFKTISNAIRQDYDNFYFIDYARSKLGIKIDPRRFPAYQIALECTELKNFTVYHFRKKIGGEPMSASATRTHV